MAKNNLKQQAETNFPGLPRFIDVAKNKGYET
jgi:hypothetical protein